jgi:cytochrome b pre-mRNA-processing protein 3
MPHHGRQTGIRSPSGVQRPDASTNHPGMEMLFGLFGRRRDTTAIDVLYGRIVASARRPALFVAGGAPDTVMGRFEVLALHVAVVLRRLRELPPPANDAAQDLVDRFFASLDDALRQIGIGDVSVPKKVKALGKAFYGRAGAYDAALAEGADQRLLAEAIARNVLDSPDDASRGAWLADDARTFVRRLAASDLAAILDGKPFADLNGAAA